MKETIRNWIKQLCKEEFPADNIVALNFGVFESLDAGITGSVLSSRVWRCNLLIIFCN